MDRFIFLYVLEKIQQFSESNICCIHWSGPLCNFDSILFQVVSHFNLKSKTHVINGYHVRKIYKLWCNHTIEMPGKKLEVTVKSQKDILYCLKNCGHVRMECLQSFCPIRDRPTLVPNRFTIGPPRNNVIHTNPDLKNIVPKTWRIYPFKEIILKKISENRILVISGDTALEKSRGVPMSIVEDCLQNKKHCKILCVELNNLQAILHSTVISKCLEERIGTRAGFQVYLQSRICNNTNIIYTTSVFFLRVLMGQTITQSFRYITHIVVSDVHAHNAYTDIFLNEIKKALPYYPEIKIILLSNSSENADFLSYFNESEQLILDLNLNAVNVYYIEQIKAIIEHMLPISKDTINLNKNEAEEALAAYEYTGTDAALNEFLYFVHADTVIINYTHSLTGCTALIAAAKHNQLQHLNILLFFEYASPFIKDKQQLTALEHAVANNSVECAKLLYDVMYGDMNVCPKPPHLDFDVLQKLIQLILVAWEFGHILVFLPSYEDLLKLNYRIQKSQFIGRMRQEVSTLILHSGIDNDEFQPIIANSLDVKIVLTTKFAESLTYLNNFTYVIDCGVNCVKQYNPELKSKAFIYEWASQESMERRSKIAGRLKEGHCFRLLPKNVFDKLPLITRPELLYTPLNRISLTAKFLSPNMSIGEYFQDTIVQPPISHILCSVEMLKKIELFDNIEQITYLACRLIDVPVNLELGKALVLSIFLRCLDPVLTITSILTSTSHSEISACLHRKKEEKLSKEADTYSDHLTLLRVYQGWQRDKQENLVNESLIDEQMFIINGIMDKVSIVRTSLVGALRSTQLIHNQGVFSMNSINSLANNWGIIKAALAGGFYPQICMLDKHNYQLKSSRVCIAPSSSLQFGPSSLYLTPSEWMIYIKPKINATLNSLANCTLISPLTIALFAGKSDLEMESLQFSNYDSATLYIDEWMWLSIENKTASMIFKLRERFHAIYLNFVKTCGQPEKWRRATLANDNERVLDVISRILLEEDIRIGFAQPTHVGNRPLAVSSKFISDIKCIGNPRSFDTIRDDILSNPFMGKEFYLASIFDSDELIKVFSTKTSFNISGYSWFNSICANLGVRQKLTYVVVYSMDRQVFTNVALVKRNKSGFYIQNTFPINIPVFKVISLCKFSNLAFPILNAKPTPIELDNRIGEIILNLL